MRITVFLLVLSMMAYLSCALPFHPESESKVASPRRPPLPSKGSNSNHQAPSELELKVTKGEYVCGDKICKLVPGVIPPGCDKHPCQYPI